MKYSPWVFLLAGVRADGAPEGKGVNTPLSFGLERASRCSAGTHNCHANAVCTFRRGEFSFQCTCRRGYIGNGEDCADLDECITHRHDCTDNESCINTDGGFYCKENKGHVRVIGQACYDGTHTCDRMATCVPDNNKKGYDCLCFEGFHGNGNKQANFEGRGGEKGCHDIDECDTFNRCDEAGQSCINTFGSYVCSTTPDPDHVCHKGQHDCHELAKCVPNPNRKRKYDCECVSGFKGNGNAQFILGDPGMIISDNPNLVFGKDGPKGCVDIDECAEKTHNCVAQSCHNQPGSFYCSSDPDPMGVCDPGRHECHPNALCVVSASNRGYDCVCKAGFNGNGNALWSRADGFFDTIAMSKGKKGCWDIDECASHSHNCIPGFQICHNVHANQGKFICIDIPGKDKLPCLNNNHNCPMGYSCFQQEQMPYYACVDDNECALGSHDCSIHQDCLNVPGTFKCLGLADPNDVCSSFNPCANNPFGLTRCVVTYNSYQCADRDECDDGSHTCHHTQYCVDVPGSFLCKPPYDPDPYELCSSFECQDDASCSLSADKKTRTCVCNPGFTQQLDGLCVDRDECTETPQICGFDFCVNQHGSYNCLNATAFSDFMCSLVDSPCGDIDPSATCLGQGTILNPITKCMCSSFFQLDPLTGKCVDKLECAVNNGACGSDTCIEQVGGPVFCDSSADPFKLCSPINPCGVHSTSCNLSPDKHSYTCTCHPGFTAGPLNDAVETCIDDDECAPNLPPKCTIYETCTNLPGQFQCEHSPDPFGKCMGFNNKCSGMATCVVSSDKLSSSCECPTGYYWGQDWQGKYACQDIDECSVGSHTCSAYEYCANMPGTYYCGLHAGPCAYGQHDCHPMAVCRPSYSKRGYDCDCIPGYKGNGNGEKATSKQRHLLLQKPTHGVAFPESQLGHAVRPNGGPVKHSGTPAAVHGIVEIDHTHGSLISYGPNGPKGCVDVDECASGIAKCVAGQTCVNSIGGFKCTNEYDPWGKCNAGQHECHPLAVCTPNIKVKRGYDCTCQAGFEGNGNFQFGRQDAIAFGVNGPRGCVDVNECATGRDKCSTYQSCINLDGGYSCVGEFDPHNKCAASKCTPLQNCIPNAYSFQGYSCQDIDECLEGIHDCTINQICVNTNYGNGHKCMGQPDPQARCVPGSPGHTACSKIQAVCLPDNSMQGYVCEDVDECAGGLGPCNAANNERCVNKANGYFCTTSNDPFNVCPGAICGPNSVCQADPLDLFSPLCTCAGGFLADAFTNECIDIDECDDPATNNCTAPDVCINEPGTFHCNSTADPYNVCATTCPPSPIANCTVSTDKLSASCTCNVGYIPDSPTTCIDDDECATTPCAVTNPPTEFCINTAGSYSCSTAADPYKVCEPGSLGDVACFHQGTCEPDDLNNRLTHKCNCNAGYNNTGTHGACVDIDECLDPTTCAADNSTVCVNTVGNFTCSNSTDPHGMCMPGNHKCGPYGTCRVTGVMKDGYTCDCVSGGYELDSTGWTCLDINECADGGNATCAADEFCLNTVGGYRCTTQSKEDPNGLCDSNVNPNALKCIGVAASCAVSGDKLSAYCACPAGFYYSQTVGCLDVNECLFSMMHVCTTQEKCINTIGSYTCQAHPDPMGKCDNAKCDPRADCVPNYTNKRGYDCLCRVGWYGNGNFQFSRNDISFGANAPKGCKDVDECANNLHDCGLTGQYCQNVEGGYKCTDKASPGHPCANGDHKCHHLATCQISTTNKVGYTCECNQGFKGNGKKQFSSITGAEIAQGGPKGCVDVDECKFNVDDCKNGQFCYNTIGSYKCHGQASADPCDGFSCSPGLKCSVDQLTGQAGCADINECMNPNMCQKGTHCVNNYASYNCVPDSIPHNPCASGTHSCNIHEECVPNGNVAVCQDRNECTTSGHDCNAFQSCYNTNPGWMCFDDHSSLCRGNKCHHKATCIANPLMKQGYDCVCNSGYHGNGNRQFRFEDQVSFGPNGPKGCVDINECKSSRFPCVDGEACINTEGGYHCMPVLDGTDVHGHCTFGAHDCDPLATCVPDPSSKRGYECQCRSGYKGNGNMQMRAEIDQIAYGGAKGCEDIDECKEDAPGNRCTIFQMCYNTAGSYQCLGEPDPFNACGSKPCGLGFACTAVNTYKGYSCSDVNECATNTHMCESYQMCINYAGSYACHNTTIIEPVTVIGNPTNVNLGGAGTTAPGPVTTTAPNTGPCASKNCAKGWECVEVGVIGQCIDIDECYRNDTSCKWGEICSNYPGGFLCLEDPDYVCRHGAHSCDKLATCVPLKVPSQGHRKGYECKCPSGYFGNGNNKPTKEDDTERFGKPKGCTDMNECLDMPCHNNETCINSAGSYFCYPNDLDEYQYETPCTVNECDFRADCVINYESKRGYDCVCKAGFHGNGNAQYRMDMKAHNGPKGCVNLDECDRGTHTCGFTQGCIDTEGSFLCVQDPYGVCLAGRHTCNEFSVCRPKPGQLWDHECECRVGSVDSCIEKCGTTWSFCYRTCLLEKGGKSNVCTDVDECDRRLHDCPSGFVCVNDSPGFYCSDAYDPYGLCDGNGPCDPVKTNCTVDATNKTLTTCDCLPGWIQNGTECIDVDECDMLNPNTTHTCNVTTEICINTEGSFDCSSDPDPFNQCNGKGDPHNCGTYDCILTTDKKDYECNCTAHGHFEPLTHSCIDYDDCANIPVRAGWTDPCLASGGFCMNLPFLSANCSMANDPLGLCDSLWCGKMGAGNCTVSADKKSASCTCNSGFILDMLKGHCEDINECNNPAASKCVAPADFCINTHGSWNCTADADPFGVCAEGAHQCGWRGVCTPDTARTSQICTCENGYYDICEKACEFSLDPLCYPSCIGSLFGKQRCKNVNECDDYKPSHTCLGSETCADLDGSFDCLSQCELANVCDTHAECVADYSEDGYHCKCKSGYHGNGKIQPKEVAAGLYGEGSYKAPKGCKDIDECAFDIHNCTAGEMCVNTEGGFNCSTAHDPFGVCEFNQHDCHPLAGCVVNHDAKRGYDCECNAGYYGNGNFQYVIDTGRKRRLAPGLAYLASHNNERGIPVDQEYLNSIPSYEEVVANGANAPKGCVNINECFYGLHDCMANEVCFDTVGGWICTPETTTPPPPTLAPTVCFMAQNECDADADCFADPIVPGGTYCKCRDGFRGDGAVKRDERGMKTRGCEDIDECEEKLDACKPFEDEFCSNLYGAYECLINTMCKGITKCHPMAQCLPIGESDYDCHCPDGYEGFGLGPKGCFDKDECADGSNKCHQTALCFNKMADQGKYECRCPDNNGGLLPNPVKSMEQCDVPDTKICGDLASHYTMHPDLVVEHLPCKEGKNGEECEFTCVNGTSTAVPSKVVCDRKRKMWMDPAGTLLDCVPPADTKCGNLLEMPFATFLLDPALGWSCKKGKESKKSYSEVCQFKCDGILMPTLTDPVEICEVKGKEELAVPQPGAISDFIYCVNPNHYTDCGVVTDYFTFVNGSDANCTAPRDNLCEFTCPTGFIPTVAESKCYTNKFNGWYDGSGVVDCIPKPPDTFCGDVKDTYSLQKDQSFTVMPDGITVIFSCPENSGKLPMPAYTVCNKVQGTYEHEVGQKIRCV